MLTATQEIKIKGLSFKDDPNLKWANNLRHKLQEIDQSVTERLMLRMLLCGRIQLC
jgi:hypothetical protein